MLYKRIFCIVLGSMVLLICGCTPATGEQYASNYSQNIVEIPVPTTDENAEDITLEDYVSVFQTEYGLSGLERHQILRCENSLQTSFWYSPDAPSYQMRNAWDFIYRKFVTGAMRKFDVQCYDWLLIERPDLWGMPLVDCRIYEGEDLLMYFSWDQNLGSSNYENLALVPEDRLLIGEESDHFKDFVHAKLGRKATVKCGQSNIQNVHFAYVHTDQPMRHEILDALQDYVQDTLYLQMQITHEAAGFVLQLACDSGIYFEGLLTNAGWEADYSINEWLTDSNLRYW
jgi:hypothetical protein